MDHPAVKLWRDTFKLNLSASWKRDVEITVKDLKLWETILANWKYQDAKGKWHWKSPAIKPLLDEYERRQFDGIEEQRKRSVSPVSHQRQDSPNGSPPRMGTDRAYWEMSQLLDRKVRRA